MGWLKSRWKKIVAIIAIIVACVAFFYVACALLVMGGVMSAASIATVSFGMVAAGASAWGASAFFLLVGVAGLAVADMLDPDAVDRVKEKLGSGIEHVGDVVVDVGETAIDVAGDLISKGWSKISEVFPWVPVALGAVGAFLLYKLTANRRDSTAELATSEVIDYDTDQ